jgi:type I restriction enzyme M protein
LKKVKTGESVEIKKDDKKIWEVVKQYGSDTFDDDASSIGYEINFSKYFYQYKPLRSLSDLTKDLLDLEKESDGLMNKLIG